VVFHWSLKYVGKEEGERQREQETKKEREIYAKTERDMQIQKENKRDK
jgi:hypothetical protein